MSARPLEAVSPGRAPIDRLAGEVDARLGQLESLADPSARQEALGAVRSLVELYGAGLERLVTMLHASDPSLPGTLADDPIVSHLLLMHDLHPVPVEQRVQKALDSVRPYIESHGGSVELLGVESGVVRLRMDGSCKGCPSSSETLKNAIEEAIYREAPDVLEVQADQLPATDAGPILITLSPPRRASG